MGKPKITLFVDIVSPFAYIGYHALRNLSVFKQCEITYVPVFLGGLMKACGNTPPIAIKNKDKWINSERDRWQKYFNVPMKEGIPENFPPNTIACQRALTAIEASNPSKLATAIDALYEAFWVRHEVISKPEVVASVLAKALGEADAKAAMEGAQGEAKKTLMANTDKSFASGAFGLPWFECENAKGEKEGFWGVDHMGQMVDFLGLERSNDFKAHL